VQLAYITVHFNFKVKMVNGKCMDKPAGYSSLRKEDIITVLLIVVDILSSSSSVSSRVVVAVVKVAVTAAAGNITALNKVITAQSEGVNTKYCATKYRNCRQ